MSDGITDGSAGPLSTQMSARSPSASASPYSSSMSWSESGWPGCSAISTRSPSRRSWTYQPVPVSAWTERDALISDQPFDNPTDLTARARAQRHRDVQGSDHPCLPDALPTRVDMQLDLV